MTSSRIGKLAIQLGSVNNSIVSKGMNKPLIICSDSSPHLNIGTINDNAARYIPEAWIEREDQNFVYWIWGKTWKTNRS